MRESNMKHYILNKMSFRADGGQVFDSLMIFDTLSAAEEHLDILTADLEQDEDENLYFDDEGNIIDFFITSAPLYKEYIDMVSIDIHKLRNDAIIPRYAHSTDSGADLYSVEDVILNPYERKLVHTGIAMAIPEGYEGCIRPRSGSTLNQGYTVLNSPGTIDSGYRGEVGVIIFNANSEAVMISRGDRIAQIVFQKLPNVVLNEVDILDDTERGIGGFGSTGI